MRRIALILSLSLLIAACSGDGESNEDGDAAAPETTTTAAVTTTAAQTTTTITASTTTVAESTDPAALTFETVAGTPPDVFDSFLANVAISMAFDDVAFDITAEGVWADGSFDCTVTSEVGGFGFEQGVIATPATLWFDAGSGYEEASLFDAEAQQVMSTCPSSPLFWADFVTEDLAGITGEETTIDGRPAIKADITELMGLGGGLGLDADFGGANVNEMAMWIDVETGAALAVVADIGLAEELLGEVDEEAPGTGSMQVLMEIKVERVNDPALAVRLP